VVWDSALSTHTHTRTIAVWLDINAPPSLTDKVNLGGGVFLNSATSTTVTNCVADGQANGYDIYNSVDIIVSNCSGCDNLGWGVHLYNTTDSTVAKQHALPRSQPSTTGAATLTTAPLLATTVDCTITTTAQRCSCDWRCRHFVHSSSIHGCQPQIVLTSLLALPLPHSQLPHCFAFPSPAQP
jgi:hypothetical protein